ncbi:hypothetical protein D3C80_1573730 [compost metagenome]
MHFVQVRAARVQIDRQARPLRARQAAQHIVQRIPDETHESTPAAGTALAQIVHPLRTGRQFRPARALQPQAHLFLACRALLLAEHDGAALARQAAVVVFDSQLPGAGRRTAAMG